MIMNLSRLPRAAAAKTADSLHARGACWLNSEDLEQIYLLAQLEAAVGLPGTPPLDPDEFLAYQFTLFSRISRAGVSLDDDVGEFEIPDERGDPLKQLEAIEDAEAQWARLEAMRNTPAGALYLLVGAGSAKSGQDRVLRAVGSRAATPASRARTTQRVIEQTLAAARGPQRDLFSFA